MKNEIILLDELINYMANIVALEQPDPRNIDYRLPETNRLFGLIAELDRELVNAVRIKGVALKKCETTENYGQTITWRKAEKRSSELMTRGVR